MFNRGFFDKRRGSSPSLLSFAFLALCTVVTVLSAFPAQAGEWRVYPIRLTLERGARIGTLTVQNDGDTPMNFQVKAMEWSQDAEGKDLYAETKELIFFPKLLMIPPHEERVIRLGLKGPAGGAKEKTYRLFVEEISPPRKDSNEGGATVAVNIRFAVPIFVPPAKEEPAGEMLKTWINNGIVSASLRNTGNVHFRIPSILFRGKDFKGNETFNQAVDGWYLLNGTTRSFSTRMSAEACKKTKLIEVEAATDRKIVLKGSHTVDGNQCK
ncbi:MAG TPA: fimbria/pilus periplasmic chaperone [Geobacteraceae bacterium]|nr:fimbria/pilus periplasmic chaperone [Geobacteraceae bacterium]